jgi:hypothetical protein
MQLSVDWIKERIATVAVVNALSGYIGGAYRAIVA